MAEHHTRMLIELSDLRERMEKLTVFVETDEFAALEFEDRILLQHQQIYMQGYADILARRVRRYVAAMR